MDRVTALFQESRPRLQAIAFRMLGSHSEAEDAVQETWLRLHRTDAERVDNLAGWLTTVTARLCLDRLRARHSRRDRASTDTDPDEVTGEDVASDPADETILAESVGAALMVVLDSLAPAERVAFVLHDVFAVPFDEIAHVVERTPAATRQLASRARRRVQGARRTHGIDLVRQRQLVDAFRRAAQAGDFGALLQILHPGAVLRPDAAAVRMGSLRPTSGAAQVAAALAGGAQAAQLAVVDGFAALVWAPLGEIRGVIEVTISAGRITAIDVTGDPERIRALEIVSIAD
jgi:RNA polymerase sigma-70 factor (ECF subfamily)